jgi:hypothetical protein
MPVDFAELQRAMGQNTQAQADFQATEDPYAYAQELRGGANLQPDAYGQISPLQILGDMIGQSTGRRDVRNIEAERKGLSQTMAAAEAMKQNYEAEGVQQDRVLKQTAEARDVSKEAREQTEFAERKDMEAGDSVTMTDGTDKITARWDNNKQTYVDNNGEPLDLSRWTVESDGSAYSGDKALTSKSLNQLAADAHQSGKLRELQSSFKDEYAQIGGLPTGFINDLMAGASYNDLMKYVSEEKDIQAKEGMLWWSKFNREFSLIERHKLFGATLTNNELKSWKEALAIGKGMDPETLLSNLGAIANDMDDRMTRQFSTLSASRRGKSDYNAIVEAGRGVFEPDEEGRFYSLYQKANPRPTPEEAQTGEGAQPKEDEQTALVQQEFTSLNPPPNIIDRLSSLPLPTQIKLMQAYIAENQNAEVVEEFGSVATSPKAKRKGQGRSTR